MADLRLYTSGIVVDSICTTDTLKCCVILCFPIRKEQEEQAVVVTYCEKMDDLLCQADFVMVVVSLTPQTHKLIGKREMELMKPSATLVNISRGSIWKMCSICWPDYQIQASSFCGAVHVLKTSRRGKNSSLPLSTLFPVWDHYLQIVLSVAVIPTQVQWWTKRHWWELCALVLSGLQLWMSPTRSRCPGLHLISPYSSETLHEAGRQGSRRCISFCSWAAHLCEIAVNKGCGPDVGSDNRLKGSGGSRKQHGGACALGE